MCAPAMIIPALAIAGTGLQVMGSIAQGRSQEAMAQAQAAAYRQQAQAEQQSSAYEQSRETYKQSLAQGAARAQVGASGAAFQGSPTSVLTEHAAQGALDIAAIQYGSRLRQNQLGTQAAITEFGGQQAKQASFINAGTSFVSGISQLYDPNKAFKMGGNPFA